MGFTRKSDFIIGDDSTYNLSSFLECLQKTYAGVGIYDLMNFGNTGIPGLKAGAIIDVQGTLYVLDADTQAVYRDSGGTVSELSGAPDGDYYLALIDASETVTIAALLISETFMTRISSYAGYYETGTANRIIGGFTKTGSSYTAKWRYQYHAHEDSYVKVTSEGVFLTANDIAVQTSIISDHLRARQIIPYGDIEAPYTDYHARIFDAGVDYNTYFQLWDRCDGGKLELASEKVYKRGGTAQYSSWGGSGVSVPSYTKFYLRGKFNIQVKYLAGHTSHIYYLVQVPDGNNPPHIRYSDAGDLIQGQYITSFAAYPGGGLNYTRDFNGWYSIVHSEPSRNDGAELQMRISLLSYAPEIQALS